MSNNTLFRRLLSGIRSTHCAEEWPGFAGDRWEEQIMSVPVTDRFHAKQGRSTGRWILEQKGEKLAVYLKRHYRLPWWKAILAALFPNRGWSPAMQECENLRWATSQGLKVPRVVAVGEQIGPWGKFQSFLAVEELKDMLPLHEAIPMASSQLSPALFQRWKQTLIQEMARIVRFLHGHRYFHKDLYLCHFYIARAHTHCLPQWRDQLYLIDLHRLARHRALWRIWQSKDLAQLLYSSDVEGITDRDRLYFWKEYLGEEGRQGRQSFIKRLILYRWRRYRRHNEKRRQREAKKQMDARSQAA